MKAAPPSSAVRKYSPWLLLGLVLLIAGCKLGLIANFASPLPLLDQWAGEGRELLQPYLHGELTAAHFFRPFNEHRIVPSRLLVLGLFRANAGQWDAQVQMLAGVFLHAACAFVLGAVLLRWFGGKRAPAVVLALLVVFALPFGWQNTLWGFQSQFYFLILFTLLSFWGLALHAPLSARWWLGVVAGLGACTSMGSGGFAGLALLCALAVKMIGGDGHARAPRWWITGLAAALLAALGFAFYTPAAAESLSSFHKPTPLEFLQAFALRLSWPHTSAPLFVLLTYAPFAMLVWQRIARRWSAESSQNPAATAAATEPEDFLFPLGFWVILQAAALAYSRNHAMTSVISRYMDLLAPGVLVNFCCLWRLLDFWMLEKARHPWRKVSLAVLLGWSLVVLSGLIPIVQRNVRVDLPGLVRVQQLQTLALRKFFATDNVADLGGKTLFGVPESSMASLATLVRDPAIRAALPSGLGLNTTEIAPGPLTAATQILVDAWQIFIGSGLLILALSLARAARNSSPKASTGMNHSSSSSVAE